MSDDKAQALQRVNKALTAVEQRNATPALRRLTVERVGSDIRVACWCGKARLLSIDHIYVFCRDFNRFLEEHSWCEQPEAN